MRVKTGYCWRKDTGTGGDPRRCWVGSRGCRFRRDRKNRTGSGRQRNYPQRVGVRRQNWSQMAQLASARESLCRGLGARWFTERFYRNALVTHVQHGQVFCTARRLENYAVTRRRLHQRAPQRRHPTDVVAVEIDLVGAHDADHSLRSRAIGIAHGRSEECPRRRLPRSRSFRVDHFRVFDSLHEKANPPIDLPQPPLAVLIVGVFTAIAVAGSPRHHLRHGRAFLSKEKPVLIFEALQTAPRYVVLALRRGLVPLWFSRKSFPHLMV